MNTALIEDYLDWLQGNRGRAPETAVKYRGYLTRLAAHYQGRDLLALTRDEIQLFAGGVAVRAGLSGRSRRALVAAIRGFYGWLQSHGHLRESPAASLPYPRAPASLPLPITLENAERLIWTPDLCTFAGIRDACWLSILVGCGLRVSGLVGLHEEDLVVSGQGQDRRLVLRVTEKGRKERQVPVPREAGLLMQAYLGHPDLADIDRRTPEGKHVLFVSVNNRRVAPGDYRGESRRITRRGINKLLEKHGRAAGIPRDQLHPHALRHLYGTELAESDVDVTIRQALMGQDDPRSAQIYTHLSARKLTRVVDSSNPLSKIRTPVSELLAAMKGS